MFIQAFCATRILRVAQTIEFCAVRRRIRVGELILARSRRVVGHRSHHRPGAYRRSDVVGSQNREGQARRVREAEGRVGRCAGTGTGNGQVERSRGESEGQRDRAARTTAVAARRKGDASQAGIRTNRVKEVRRRQVDGLIPG